MTYPRSVARFRPIRGVANDPPAWEVGPDFYTDALNFLFRDGRARRIGGARDVYATVQDDVRNLLNVRISANNYWVYHGTDKSYAVEGSTHTDITHASTLTAQADAHKWTSGLLNGLPFANNGLDEPMAWDGNTANKFVTLTGWTANDVCEAMIAHRFHLFALAPTESGTYYPHRIRWSGAAQPGAMPNVWTPAATNEAGFADLAAFGGPLIKAETLLDQLAIYARSATWVGQYIEGRTYQFRPAFSTTGILTRHGVADVGRGRHLVVTDGDIILTDLVDRQSICKGRMADYVFRQMNTDYYESTFVLHDRAANATLVAFPTGDADTCDRGVVYSHDFDSWEPVELPDVSCGAVGIVSDTTGSQAWNDDSDTWDSDNTLWNEATFSLANEVLVVGEPGTPAMTQLDTSDAVAIDATLTKQDMALGDPDRVKLVRAVHVDVADGYGTLYVRVGARNSQSDSITWSAEVTLTEPEKIANTFARGKYISVQIRSEDSWEPEISGFGIDHDLRGYH